MKTNKLTTEALESIKLQIEESDRDRAWTQSQNHSNTLAQYNSYLNNVCLATFAKWFKDWIPEDLKLDLPHPESLANIWDFVNGTAIQIGETRLVLIPCDELESETFYIPQEWIDIPSWRGDYYLPVEVGLGTEDDEFWIEICGFTTHRQLKVNGTYNEIDRTYAIERKELIANLEVMLMTMALNLKVEVSTLPTLSIAEVTKLMEVLGDRSIYSPRLHLSFEKWAVLLENEEYRQELFDRRLGKVLAVKVEETKPIKKAIELRQWLQNTAQKTLNSISDTYSWQSYESLFSEAAYAPAVRSSVNIQTNSAETINDLIPLLDPHNADEIRTSAATILGEVGFGNNRVIHALSKVLQNDIEDNLRLQASLSLGKIDPGNPMSGRRNARLIDLGMKLDDYEVALIVVILPDSNGRLKVNVMLKVRNSLKKLPPHLKLSVLKKSGESISGLEVETRSDNRGQGLDEIIELQSFSPPPESRFRVQVSLKDIIVTEDFIA